MSEGYPLLRGGESRIPSLLLFPTPELKNLPQLDITPYEFREAFENRIDSNEVNLLDAVFGHHPVKRVLAQRQAKLFAGGRLDLGNLKVVGFQKFFEGQTNCHTHNLCHAPDVYLESSDSA